MDLRHPPAQDESTALAGLLTAICRPSLPLAPGLLVSAPAISGASSGKGTLIRCISAIAYGAAPRAVAPGDSKETEARLVGELMAERPVLWLDNLNGRSLKSDLMASLMTETEVAVRPLGTSVMVNLRPRAWVAMSGNGLVPSEDMVRRFITVQLDPKVEDAETRKFEPGFLNHIHGRRADLLSAALTIWRWGRQQRDALPRGPILASYEGWSEWVLWPLLALGGANPVEQMRAAKAFDPRRERTREILEAWFEAHGSAPVTAKDLAETVRAAVDPIGSRQSLARAVQLLAGQRVAGYSCVALPKVGHWSAQRYRVDRLEFDGVGQEGEPRPPSSPLQIYVPGDEVTSVATLH